MSEDTEANVKGLPLSKNWAFCNCKWPAHIEYTKTHRFVMNLQARIQGSNCWENEINPLIKLNISETIRCCLTYDKMLYEASSNHLLSILVKKQKTKN